MTKNIHKLGNLTRDDIKFPEHLTPEVVHIALFIHNAECKEETIKRVEHGIKTVEFRSGPEPSPRSLDADPPPPLRKKRGPTAFPFMA